MAYKQKEFHPIVKPDNIEMLKTLLDDQEKKSEPGHHDEFMHSVMNDKQMMGLISKYFFNLENASDGTPKEHTDKSKDQKILSFLHEAVEIINNPDQIVSDEPEDTTAPSSTTSIPIETPGLVITDVCDRPVIAALARQESSRNLEEQFFTRWKQFHRARVLHRKIFRPYSEVENPNIKKQFSFP